MSERKRIVIVGGVAGGASAAARARRMSEEAEIILFERGEHISYANCGMPYYIGGVIRDRDRLLVQTPEAMRRRFRVEVRTKTEVVRIDRERKEVVAQKVDTGDEERVRYDVLILSPGAQPVLPPIPGVESEQVRTLRTLEDMDAIKRLADQAKGARAVVVGGGYVGLEMVESLRHAGLDVTLVEMLPQVFSPVDREFASRLHRELRSNGVDLRISTSVTKFEERPEGVTVQLSSGEQVGCSFAVLAVGVRPEVTLAREAGLAIGERGGIVVDNRMRTSDPDIYAVGDAVEVRNFVTGKPCLVPLAGPANRQGRIAADNALGGQRTYEGTQGTAICKVFGQTVAVTGMNEKALQQEGIAYEKVVVHPASHATYYPGAAPLTLKLLFDPHEGRILGAQAMGTEGVDKRIDVLATAMRAGMTVFGLEDLELAYAPPYGSAKDPVNYAGFVAANALRGDAALAHWEEVANLKEGQFLLDVRTPAEVAAGAIPGAVNVPIDELRDRLDEIPRDREVIAYCRTGVRSYIACRILTQHGFRCRNLTGGYVTYAEAMELEAAEEEQEEICNNAGEGGTGSH